MHASHSVNSLGLPLLVLFVISLVAVLSLTSAFSLSLACHFLGQSRIRLRKQRPYVRRPSAHFGAFLLASILNEEVHGFLKAVGTIYIIVFLQSKQEGPGGPIEI